LDTTTLVAFVSEMMGVVAVTMLLALSPRLAPLPIAFRQPGQELRRALVLSGLLLLIDIGAQFLPVWEPAPSFGVLAPAEITDVTRTALLYRLAVDLLGLLPFAVSLAMSERYQHPFPTIGWNRRDLRPAFQLGLGLGLVTLFLSGRIFSVFDGTNAESLFALIVWLVIALVEETIFRGYIQSRLSAAWGQRYGWIGAAVVSTLFALPPLLARPDALVQIALVAVQSLVLGYIYRKTGHVLAGSIYRAISAWAPFIV
jgi:membrane protease YdiL (CAAX protease family)